MKDGILSFKRHNNQRLLCGLFELWALLFMTFILSCVYITQTTRLKKIMKTIKYVLFTPLFLANIYILYAFLRSFYVYYSGGAAKILAESSFEHTREVYMGFHCLTLAACFFILLFSIKKLNRFPCFSFFLSVLPIVYFIFVIFIFDIF